ncbi:MAG: HAD family acid phosphatase [Bacteroidota bacterium]
MLSRFLLPAVLLALTGCSQLATAPAEAPSPSVSTATDLPLDIRWVRRSAEHRAVYAQTYRAAGLHLRAVADTLSARDWAVVLDADETLLDNSLYQRERAEIGLGFTPETWNDWVRREEATALPGAVAFTSLIRDLGGRVVVVTNRDDIVCDETRRNLAAVGIAVDGVLCKDEGSDKNVRFARVERGELEGLPPLTVVMWLGDNIGDFPRLSQDVRFEGEDALSLFGSQYWAFPNPMYGSWTGNAEATTD